MNRLSWIVAVLLVFDASAFAGLKIGDKAPKVKVAKWLTSAPPALPGEAGAEKNVFLVEFWATWCGPCRRSIPHLAELHRKYGKDGVVILGVSNEDAPTIEKFLSKSQGGKPPDMPYHVGADDDMATNEVWMKDISGIPHAFIVDKASNVVWTGHPLAPDMTEALAQVIAGKYDVETAKNAAAAAKKYDELMSQANMASQMQENEKLAQIIDQMMAVKPRDVMPYLMKRHLLAQTNKREEIPSLDAKMEAAMRDSLGGLQQIIAFQLDQKLSQRSAGQLFRCAKRAEELTQGRDPDVLALLAQVQCELGMIDAAISTQDRAVGLAPDAARDDFKKTLKYYQDAKALTVKPGS
jgi:thiol-disulfide isomerase/thioredoxin